MNCCETQRMPSRTGCHTCVCSKCSCNWTALADTPRFRSISIYIGLSNGCDRNDHFHLCGNLCAPRRNVWIVSVTGLKGRCSVEGLFILWKFGKGIKIPVRWQGLLVCPLGTWTVAAKLHITTLAFTLGKTKWVLGPVWSTFTSMITNE